MNETSPNFVTTREFRLVSLGLAILSIIVILLSLLGVLRRPNALPSPPTVSTPIVIRGGSMTAFTEQVGAPGGWMPKTPPNLLSYCADVSTSTANTNFFVELRDNDTAWTVLGHWDNPTSLDIHEHDLSNTSVWQASKTSGFRLTLQQTACDTITAKKSVWISTLGGIFYPFRLPGRSSHTESLRFQDTSSTCRTDEDACERMADIVVTMNGTVQPAVTCLDGDCTVVIGIK
jgi:hypothetical protein